MYSVSDYTSYEVRTAWAAFLPISIKANSMKYDNVAFFQSLMMQMWDTIPWETNESDEGFQFACDSLFSSQLG